MSSSKKPLPCQPADDATHPGEPPPENKGVASPRGVGLRLLGLGFVAILAITVVGLIAVAVRKAWQMDRIPSYVTPLNQLAMAVNLCHDTNKTIPPLNGPYGARIKAPFTFHVHLLANIDQQQLYNDPAPVVVSIFVSRLDKTADGTGGLTNYPVNYQLFMSRTGEPLVKPLSWTQMRDGPSNTLLFATTWQKCPTNGATSDWLNGTAHFGQNMGMWQTPNRAAPCVADGRAVALTTESIQVVFCDRNTRNMTSASITPAVWAALHTPNGIESDHNYDQ